MRVARRQTLTSPKTSLPFPPSPLPTKLYPASGPITDRSPARSGGPWLVPEPPGPPSPGPGPAEVGAGRLPIRVYY